MPDNQTGVVRLVSALEAPGYPFAHFGWSRAPEGTYGVWTEESGGDLLADNVHAERATRFSVDLYTRDGSSTPRDAVEAALNGLRCAWKLDSVLYEADTGLVHYFWRVGLYGC